MGVKLNYKLSITRNIIYDSEDIKWNLLKDLNINIIGQTWQDIIQAI